MFFPAPSTPVAALPDILDMCDCVDHQAQALNSAMSQGTVQQVKDVFIGLCKRRLYQEIPEDQLFSAILSRNEDGYPALHVRPTAEHLAAYLDGIVSLALRGDFSPDMVLKLLRSRPQGMETFTATRHLMSSGDEACLRTLGNALIKMHRLGLLAHEGLRELLLDHPARRPAPRPPLPSTARVRPFDSRQRYEALKPLVDYGIARQVIDAQDIPKPA